MCIRDRPNIDGRITDEKGTVLSGLYCAGWIKRGPSGIIGTNRADSVATVKALLADIDGGRIDTAIQQGAQAIYPPLAARDFGGVDSLPFRESENAHVARGKPAGKPREKFTRASEM